MPISFEFLRGVIGIIGLACAYMAGRSLIAVRKGWQKPGTLYGWIVRAVLCLAAIAFRHAVDWRAIALWTISGAAFAMATWQTSRRKPPEDLTRQIFPE